MRIVFGALSMLLAVAVAGVLSKKQLSARAMQQARPMPEDK